MRAIASWLRRHPAWANLFLAVATFGLMVLAVEAIYSLFEHDPVTISELPDRSHSVLWSAVLSAPLAFRSRFPGTVLMAVTAAFVVFRIIEVPESNVSSIAMFIAFYTAGAKARRPWHHVTRVISLLTMVVVISVAIVSDAPTVDGNILLLAAFTVLFNVVFFAAAWWVGDLSRIRRHQFDELERRADQLRAEREERSRQAVVEERVRIARELHDVVAHHVSVMGVQAGAARRVLDHDPETASGVLASIETSSRQAVGELQRLLGLLRSHDAATDDHAPQPRLGELDALLAQLGEAGLEVRLTTIGSPVDLNASADLSAYRIIQEALTNVLKHAGPAATLVTLTYAVDGLTISVRNEPGSGGTIDGGGRGITGMEERAAMVGGTLTAGPTGDGGWEVEAWIPYSGSRLEAMEHGA